MQEVETEILSLADMCCDAVKDGLQALKGNSQESRTAFVVTGSLIRILISALRCSSAKLLHKMSMTYSLLTTTYSLCMGSERVT